MFISALSSWCTHNALLILILKYAGMHSLLQETHLKWWICKCPPPRSHTTIYSIYMLGLCLHVYVVFNLTSFNPHNASSHIALGHTAILTFFLFLVCFFLILHQPRPGLCQRCSKVKSFEGTSCKNVFISTDVTWIRHKRRGSSVRDTSVSCYLSFSWLEIKSDAAKDNGNIYQPVKSKNCQLRK